MQTDIPVIGATGAPPPVVFTDAAADKVSELIEDESNPDLMRPGMSVRSEILPAPLEQVVIAPRAGIDFSGETPRARLAGGGLESYLEGAFPWERRQLFRHMALAAKAQGDHGEADKLRALAHATDDT